jgi:DHA3 family macrolide efflux protein-like MFS transporter
MTGLIRGFGLFWFGQTVSYVGSALTTFVLGVWVYQQTGSATQFAIISLAAVLPAIIAAPFAGVLADRRNRKHLIIAVDLGAGAVTAILAALLWTDSLQVWHIYVATAITACLTTVHMTAFYTMMPLLVPKERLGNANGMMQMTQAGQIAAPLLAGALVGTIGLRGVVLIDLCTMVIGISLLLTARLAGAAEPPQSGKQVTLLQDLGHGWKTLRGTSTLFQLALIFGAFNFFFAMAGVLVQPLILSFSSTATLGILMFAGGAGIFLGGLAMSTWGGPKKRVRGIIGFLAVAGVALSLHSLSPSPWLIAVVAPLFLFTLPILGGSVMTLVQGKVPVESLGRVIATIRVIGQSAMPLAYLLAGPLADKVAGPALQPNGSLAGSVGAITGTGPGRGIAAIFLFLGLAMVLLSIAAAANPRLRELDAPDLAAPEPAPAEPSAAEPAAPEPGVVSPVVANSATANAESAARESVAAELATAEPAAAEAAVAPAQGGEPAISTVSEEDENAKERHAGRTA